MSRKALPVADWAEIYGTQEIGARDSQQDAWESAWLPGEDDATTPRLLLVVADGMGGHAAGDIASRVALNAFMAVAKNEPRTASQPLLFKGLHAAGSALFEKAVADPSLKTMGTTLLAVIVEAKNKAFQYRMVSVGDSPLWHWHHGEQDITRANADHSLAGQLAKDLEEGRITRAQAEQDPRKDMGNVLTSALMAEREHDYDIDATDTAPRPLSEGDVLLLSSDGLDTLSPVGIADCLKSIDDRAGATEKAVKSMLDAVRAEAVAHQDNVTAVAVRVGALKRKTGWFGFNR